jgi:hypothetical protein
MHPARIWTEHPTSKAVQNETTLCASLELSHKTLVADRTFPRHPCWCMNTRVLAVIPASQWHMERAKAGLAILMPER